MAGTDFKDYYTILGVEKTSSAEDIKKKFRKLALKYHPDRNPGDRAAEEKFKEISEAYEILSDPEKRQKYDQFGQYWQQTTRSGYSTDGRGVEVNFGDFDFGRYGSFDEFINELLGKFSTGPQYDGSRYSDFDTGATSGRRSPAGLDREAGISLTFAEGFRGVERRINLGTEVIDVKIPAGIKNGSKVRIKGKGEPSPLGGQRGDLYLIVNLKPHPFFQLDEDNLTCTIPITLDEAALGASVQVPTPDGMVNMKIPAGIRSGQSLRLRNKGWITPRGQRTDQLVKVEIVVPESLSEAEKNCYRQLQSLRTSDPRKHLKNIAL